MNHTLARHFARHYAEQNGHPVPGLAPAAQDAPGPHSAFPLANRPLADIEREAILATLESTGGNKTEAARRMGVTARTLSNKMKLWRQLGLVA